MDRPRDSVWSPRCAGGEPRQARSDGGGEPAHRLSSRLPPPPTVHSWAEGHMQSVGLYKIVQALAL
ncbi:hypothetical protein J6590_005459 [Homalodisca vitripennis]|nr:hypothetical protein J6590_005459 [Homalodisca vitripennis]